MHTAFFDFTVESAEFVEEYAGYVPAEGKALLDTVFTIKDTYGDDLPIYHTDFQIMWGDGEQDFGYGLTGLEDETVLPEELIMNKRETVTYHIVYEVPADAREFTIGYIEIYYDETQGDEMHEGDLFLVNFKREGA